MAGTPGMDMSFSALPDFEEAPADFAAVSAVSYDFSEQDCTEFVNAIFGLEEETADDAQSVQTDAAAAEANSGAEQYLSYIDKLIATEQLVPVTLPEELLPDRTESLTFSHEGFKFSLDIRFYGEQMCVLGYDGQGQQLCFMSDMSAEEYDTFVKDCLLLNEVE